jgi:photosystem II stability/assembly factor-like uncharacterized protein
VVLDPTAPQTAYAIYSETNSDRRKVFKSTNGGATWRSISNGPSPAASCPPRRRSARAADRLRRLPQRLLQKRRRRRHRRESTGFGHFFTLAPHPTRAGTLYAGTGAGVYRSVDGGAHWTAVNDGLAGLQVYALGFSPATSRTLFAGTSLGAFGGLVGGVFKSADAAGSWQFSSHGIHALSANVFAVSPSNPSILWLSTDAGLWKSNDRGDSWTRIRFEAGCPAARTDRPRPRGPDTAYLTTNGSVGLRGLRLHDGGAFWQPLRPAGRVFRTRPAGPRYLWRRAPGSEEPRRWPDLIPERRARALEIHEILPAPSASGTVYAFGSRPRLPLLRVAADHRRGRQLAERRHPAGSGFDSLVVDPFDPQILYSTERGTLRRSGNGGTSWSVVSNALFPSSGILSAPRGAAGRLYYAAKGDTVYESSDGGASWSPLGDRPDFNFFQFFLTGDPGDPNRLYVGTSGVAPGVHLHAVTCDVACSGVPRRSRRGHPPVEPGGVPGGA